MEFRMKRVYEEPADDDRVRVLADRLWPRGLSKEKAKLDQWPKGVTPSTDLRKWYHQNPDSFAEFSKRYRIELDANASAVEELRSAGDTVTLLTATKEIEHSQLPVLLDYLQNN